MRAQHTLIAIAALVASAGTAAAQTTGTASFNAPYRAFEKYEFGGTLSFNDNDVTGVEGQIRFGYKAFDIGARGGMAFTSGDDAVLLGIEGRGRVLTHSEQFPVDGAIIVGFGAAFDGGSVFNIPVGLSLGRRVDIENSEISIIPYLQPTLNMVFGDTPDPPEFGFGTGFGLDARLSRFFDVRVSAGLGTDWAIEGFAVSAVWIR
jgi:hypothetical protein